MKNTADQPSPICSRHEGQAPADHAARHNAGRGGSRREGRHRHRLRAADLCSARLSRGRPQTPSPCPGLNIFDYVSAEDYMREAFVDATRQAVTQSIAPQARHDQAHARRGHSGLRPCRPHPFQGDLDRRLRAVGKTAVSAIEIWRQPRRWKRPAPSPCRNRGRAGDVAAAISATPRC
jgi:hypothetical protein